MSTAFTTQGIVLYQGTKIAKWIVPYHAVYTGAWYITGYVIIKFSINKKRVQLVAANTGSD